MGGEGKERKRGGEGRDGKVIIFCYYLRIIGFQLSFEKQILSWLSVVQLQIMSSIINKTVTRGC
jgi:hypothetical protein